MKKTRLCVGFAFHVIVASVMIFSAIVKFLELSAHGNPGGQSSEFVLPLAVFELANALVLLIPRTMSAGVLITSAGWGAVIALCVVEANAQIAPMHPVVPMAFLAMTWVGGYLRDPRMLYSFESAGS